MNPATFIPTIAQVRMLNMMHLGSSYFKTPSYYRFSTSDVQLSESDTDLSLVIPVVDGVVNDDGSNQLSGSAGGDNSTDNNTIFKSGGGVSDVTAQNLIANNTNSSKVWVLSDLSVNGTVIDSSKYAGLWFYIKDSTVYDKLISSGYCIEVNYGIDGSNYFYYRKDRDDLSVGWNFISSDSIVSSLSEVGTVTGNIDYFVITVRTNNVTDTFVDGDLVYDLLRTWDDVDTGKIIKSGYPLVNESEVYAEIQCRLEKTEAVGFLITSYALYNDADEVMYFVQLSEGESKSINDIFLANILRRERNRRVTI